MKKRLFKSIFVIFIDVIPALLTYWDILEKGYNIIGY